MTFLLSGNGKELRRVDQINKIKSDTKRVSSAAATAVFVSLFHSAAAIADYTKLVVCCNICWGV